MKTVCSKSYGDTMSESEPPTIPLRVPPLKLHVRSNSNNDPTPTKIFRPLTIVAVCFFLAIIGWGTWHVINRPSPDDDGATIAEFEELESELPTLGTRTKLSDPILALRPNITIPAMTGPGSTELTGDRANGNEIWLTGTIDDTEPNGGPKSTRQLQISGDPNDTSIFR